MNTQQLECAINSDPFMRNYVIGTFPADRTPLQIPLKCGLILNTDPSGLPGQHWLAFYYNEDKQLECFDSYGNHPDKYSVYIQSFLRRFSNIKMNTTRLQSANSQVCGQYCLFYLMCRCRGYSMSTFLNYFGNNYCANDEYVYDIVQSQFSCCVKYCMHGQSCVCEK